MAGDRKGKVNQVVQKKKKTREDREWEHALAAADVADQPQRSVGIREIGAQGETETAPQQLRHSGRTMGSEMAQTTPPSHSSPRTRGGATQKTAGRVQQHPSNDS